MVLYGAMIRPFRALLGWLLAMLILVPSVDARAGDTTEAAIRELSANQDFRVRTQAALALGASGDETVVEPLCRALDDSKAAVRAAAAAALGKLRRGGRECLSARQSKEDTDSVKSAITRAIQTLSLPDTSGTAPVGVVDGTTRLYISVGKTADGTQRKKSRVHELVRATIARSVTQQKGTVVGPDGETKPQYLKRIGGRKGIKGLLLAPKVQAPEYSGDSLTVRLEIAILTFPEKALKGTIPIKMTQQGSVKQSESTEDELLAMAVERAVEKLIKNLERIE